jgi:hypothetical protein
MKFKLLATMFVAVYASIAAPAFASGYGPAPFYSPQIGAPASQRGQSAQTLQAEQQNAVNVAYDGSSRTAGRDAIHAGRLPTPGEQ